MNYGPVIKLSSAFSGTLALSNGVHQACRRAKWALLGLVALGRGKCLAGRKMETRKTMKTDEPRNRKSSKEDFVVGGLEKLRGPQGSMSHVHTSPFFFFLLIYHFFFLF